MPPAAPWRACPAGVEIRVRLTPRSARDAVEGMATRGGEAVLKLRVRAAAENGAANDAARRLIAGALRQPPSAVTLKSGATARTKVFRVRGGDLASVAAALTPEGAAA